MDDRHVKTIIRQINGDAREIVIAILIAALLVVVAVVCREEIRSMLHLGVA